MTILHWQRGGSMGGRPVVLVHGWAGSGQRAWEDSGWMVAVAKAGYEALVCDLPGHAGSGDIPLPAGVEPAAWSAELIVADLQRLGITAFAVGGFSEGALVAAHLAVRAPSDVQPLVLIGCDDRVGIPHGDMVIAGLRDPRTNLWDAEAAERVAQARSDRRNDLETLALWAEHARWPAAARLGALRTSVLLAVGTEDDHRHTAPRLAGLFHDARLVTVPAGYRDLLAAPELHRQVMAFLTECEEGAANAGH